MDKNVCRAEPTKSGKAEQLRNDECGRAEPTSNETECGKYECGRVERARKGTECGKDGEELSGTEPTMPMGAKPVECGKIGYERAEPGNKGTECGKVDGHQSWRSPLNAKKN